jgi:glutamate carboxypeptidase
VDIKGGTVLIYMVLEALQEFHPEIFESFHWLLALNASEEALSSDFTSQLIQRLPEKTMACLVFEGGTPSANAVPLVVSRKGRATYQVEVAGRSAHAGNNHAQGANAILQIAHTIQHIEALTDYTQEITFNVGTVRGGSVVNRVPHSAQASVEMRAFSPHVFQHGVERMLALDGTTQVTSQDGFPCQVRVQLSEQTAPWPANPETDRLYAIWQAAAASLGWQTLTEKRGGLSDGNHLWQRFPTLDGLGPSGANAHCSESTPDGSKQQEYVEISSFVPKALLNVAGIVRLVGNRE